MGRGILFIAGIAFAALLLLIIAAIVRLLMLFVQLVTPRYALTISVLALTLWFVDSRRRRYAKGFYSCSRIPHTPTTSLQLNDQTEQKEEEKQFTQKSAAVPLVTSAVDGEFKKVASAPPSETESEDDESEVTDRKVMNVRKSFLSRASPSSCSKSFVDVRTCSNTTDGAVQRRQATRPRSSSATGNTKSSPLPVTRSMLHGSNADRTERQHKMIRRRTDTSKTKQMEQIERSRLAMFMSKQQDVCIPSRRSSSDRLQDALRSEGYWIGDFRLVSRRGHSPKM